jgi:hypothetical protein
LTETRHHCLQDLRRDWCGGIMVEIEVLHLYSFYQ